MPDLYIITAVKHKNPRVNNLRFKPGEEYSIQTFKDFAAEEAMTFERIPRGNGSTIRLYDYYDRLILQAESQPEYIQQ
jgi:hypothetical protein